MIHPPRILDPTLNSIMMLIVSVMLVFGMLCGGTWVVYKGIGGVIGGGIKNNNLSFRKNKNCVVKQYVEGE